MNYLLTRVRGKLRWFTFHHHSRITDGEAKTGAPEILARAKKGIDRRDT